MRRPRDAYRQKLPWQVDGDFPSLRRLPVTTPEVLAQLPRSLGARPGLRYLAATPYYERGAEAVTLDRGADLAGWQQLAWVSRETGEPVRSRWT